jgi:hypothetical protein
MPRIILSFIVFILLSAGGVAVYLWLPRDHPAATPDLTLLNESLRRSMESEIGEPLLTRNLVELTIKGQDLDFEIERIKDLAAKLGGTATVNRRSGESDQGLLVEVPQSVAQPFMEAAQNRAKVVLADLPNAEEKRQVIEVKLHVRE